MKKVPLIPFLISILVIAPNKLRSQSSVEAINIQKVRTYWEEVWGKGNLQAVADFYHPNAKHGENFTIPGFQKSVASQREAFPDFKATITDIFSIGDKVVSEVIYTGTHTGRKMFKQNPLGKAIKVPGLDIFTFKDGKCVNHQHVADHLDLVLQMGIKLVPVKDTQAVVKEVTKSSDEYIQLIKSLHRSEIIDTARKNYIDAISNKLATEYEYTDAEGKTYNKKDDLEYYKNPTVKLNSSEVTERKIKTIDSNTAIETGILKFIGTNKEKAFSYKKKFTTTWIFREGRWQIIADHASKME